MITKTTGSFPLYESRVKMSSLKHLKTEELQERGYPKSPAYISRPFSWMVNLQSGFICHFVNLHVAAMCPANGGRTARTARRTARPGVTWSWVVSRPMKGASSHVGT